MYIWPPVLLAPRPRRPDRAVLTCWGEQRIWRWHAPAPLGVKLCALLLLLIPLFGMSGAAMSTAQTALIIERSSLRRALDPKNKKKNQ